MSFSGIGLLASDLEDATCQADIISNCRTLIGMIDEHIRERNGAGYTYADTRVPQSLTVAGLRQSDAQALIYAELLQIYAGDPNDTENPGKGFNNVKLIVIPTDRGEDWLFHTEWKNMLSTQEKEAKMKIITQFTERRPYVEKTPRQRSPAMAPGGNSTKK